MLKGKSMILLVCAVVIEEGGKKEDEESALNIPLRQEKTFPIHSENLLRSKPSLGAIGTRC